MYYFFFFDSSRVYVFICFFSLLGCVISIYERAFAKGVVFNPQTCIIFVLVLPLVVTLKLLYLFMYTCTFFFLPFF